MSFSKLKELVGDSKEALEVIGLLEASATSNIETINNLERQRAEVISTRDKYKDGNSLVKSILGVDAINEETLKEALKTLKGSSGDEKLTAEITSLKDLIAKANNEKSEIATTYEHKLQTMALDNALASAGVGTSFANEAMYKLGINLIKDGASFENGTIVYKKSDGSTDYGSGTTPMTVIDKMNSLKTDANYAGLFKPDVNSGSGTPPNGQRTAGALTMSRSQLQSKTPVEQSKFFADGGSLTEN